MAISRSKAPFPLLPAAAAAVPLAFGPWWRDAFGLPKFAAAAAFSLCGIALLARSGELFTIRSRVDPALALFCALAVLSALYSADPDPSWYGERLEYLFGLSGLAGCVAAFYLGCAEARSGAGRLIRWAAAGSLPVSAYALAQGAGWRPLSWRSSEAAGLLSWEPGLLGGRAASAFGAPVSLGAYLAVIAPLALHLAVGSGNTARTRRLGGIVLAAAVAALALTGSRGAWLGAAAGAAFALSVRSRKAAAAVLLGALIAAAAMGPRLRPDAAASDSLRAGIWRAGVASWKDAPWLGTGIGTFVIGYRRHKGSGLARLGPSEGYPRNAHNDWLEVLATMGLVGAAAYAWLHASAIRGAAAAIRADGTGAAAALAAAVLAALVVAKFNPLSFAPAWLASACAGCLLASRAATQARAGRPSLLAAAPALLAAASVLWFSWAAWRWASADRQDLLGGLSRAAGHPRDAAGHFESAVALRPGVARYRADLADLLWDVSGGLGPEARRELLLRAAQTAAEGVRLRPLDPELYRLLGLAELRRAEWGGEDRSGQALAAFQGADGLDPDSADTLKELERASALYKSRRSTTGGPAAPGG